MDVKYRLDKCNENRTHPQTFATSISWRQGEDIGLKITGHPEEGSKTGSPGPADCKVGELAHGHGSTA
jgi:hypothetical protein